MDHYQKDRVVPGEQAGIGKRDQNTGRLAQHKQADRSEGGAEDVGEDILLATGKVKTGQL